MERLIQEDYREDPWKMVVCCILLNQTTNTQVRRVLNDLFSLIPNPEKASIEDPERISKIIRCTGFQNVKAKRIVNLSKKWVSGFADPSELPGVGKYAHDSWKIFILGDLCLSVEDKKLKEYIANNR